MYHFSLYMQKITLSRIIREEVIRALVFGISLFAILFAGFATLAYAADGGEFGRILNLILVKSWNDPTNDGKVKNCEKLWNKLPSEYAQVWAAGFSCPGTQCIYGTQANGTPMCR